MDKGLLIVVSGPSGAGKGTVMHAFLERHKEAYMSVSATTRTMRPGEVDGINYHFMTEEAFLKLKQADGFLEQACFCGNYYGTPKKQAMDKIDSGTDVILEIEVQGAMQVRAKYPEGVFIFIVPPSMEELRRRLVDRQTETADVIEKRLDTAKRELTLLDKYNYIVTNDDVDAAVSRIEAIITAEKLRMERTIKTMEEKFL